MVARREPWASSIATRAAIPPPFFAVRFIRGAVGSTATAEADTASVASVEVGPLAQFGEWDEHDKDVASMAEAIADTIRELDDFGYECFWALDKGKLVTITRCWHPTWTHKHSWSNVVCARREDACAVETLRRFRAYAPS